MVKRPSYTPEDFEKMTDAERTAASLEYDLADLLEYLDTGEIRTHLSTKAAMAFYDHQKWRWDNIKPEIAAFEQRWIKVYALVCADTTAIEWAAKEFEFKHWMGFCDEDVKELMRLYRHHDYFDWENASEEEKEAWYALWNPQGVKQGDSKLKGWQPYIDRRDKKPLQELYKESPTFMSTRGSILDHLAQATCSPEGAFVTKHLDVCLGSSAGRVLLTISDKLKRDDPENVFDGARLTLIFDEDAPYPRGGIQGQAATRDEAVGMLKALSAFMPTLTSDTNLAIF